MRHVDYISSNPTGKLPLFWSRTVELQGLFVITAYPWRLLDSLHVISGEIRMGRHVRHSYQICSLFHSFWRNYVPMGLCAWASPSHYLHQWWNIVDTNLRNKLQWNLKLNSFIFIQENAFENVVCEMASISSRPQWVNEACIHWAETCYNCKQICTKYYITYEICGFVHINSKICCGYIILFIFKRVKNSNFSSSYWLTYFTTSYQTHLNIIIVLSRHILTPLVQGSVCL